MAKKFLVPLSVNGLASDPASGSEGDLYFNTISKSLKIYKNGAWEEIGGAGNDSASIIAYVDQNVDDLYDLIFDGQYTDDIEEGVTNLYFTDQRAIDAVGIPSQTGNAGRYLTTNGASASWGVVDALPSQTGNAGKYLTTDGTDPSWAELDLVAGIQAASAAATASAFIYTDQQIALIENDPSVISYKRWNKLLSGSASVISGLDDDSETLDYISGLEQVYINGAFIDRDSYTATNGSSITFDEPLYPGDIVEVLCLKNTSVATESDLATTISRWTKTLSASTTLIASTDDNAEELNYSVGYMTLFINGVLIDPSEYTATDGTHIELDVAAKVGDVVEVLTYRTLNIADFYTKLESDNRYIDSYEIQSYATLAGLAASTQYAIASASAYTDSEIAALEVFSTIATSPETQTIVGDSNSDTLTFVAGENISIVAASASDSITINSTGNYTSVDSISYPDYIVFDTTPETTSASVGTLAWDTGEGNLSLQLTTDSNIGLGQELIVLCRNGEATQLNKGEVVRLDGASGQRPKVMRAYSNDGDTGSALTIGIVNENIASGAEGFVVTQGVVRNINTNGFNEGDTLYLSPTPGVLSTTKPQAPDHLVFVAVVLKKNAASGRLYVKPQNGYEIDELHNVRIVSPQNDDLILYNSASSIWVNSPKQDIINTASAAAVSYLVDGAPGALDTLNELAEALNDNADILDLYLTQASASVLYEPEIPYVSASPSGPSAGTLWIDSTNAAAPALKVYNGTEWIAVSGAASESGFHPFFGAYK
jgi:hypothetical protein